MTIYTPKGSHEHYTSTDRHYCPKTETYTGADSLLTAQRNGWHLVGVAYRETIIFGGGRHTCIYHFELHRLGETLMMPIVENPYVGRLIEQYHMDILEASYDMPRSTVDSMFIA